VQKGSVPGCGKEGEAASSSGQIIAVRAEGADRIDPLSADPESLGLGIALPWRRLSIFNRHFRPKIDGTPM